MCWFFGDSTSLQRQRVPGRSSFAACVAPLTSFRMQALEHFRFDLPPRDGLHCARIQLFRTPAEFGGPRSRPFRIRRSLCAIEDLRRERNRPLLRSAIALRRFVVIGYNRA